MLGEKQKQDINALDHQQVQNYSQQQFTSLFTPHSSNNNTSPGIQTIQTKPPSLLQIQTYNPQWLLSPWSELAPTAPAQSRLALAPPMHQSSMHRKLKLFSSKWTGPKTRSPKAPLAASDGSRDSKLNSLLIIFDIR